MIDSEIQARNSKKHCLEVCSRLTLAVMIPFGRPTAPIGLGILAPSMRMTSQKYKKTPMSIKKTTYR